MGPKKTDPQLEKRRFSTQSFSLECLLLVKYEIQKLILGKPIIHEKSFNPSSTHQIESNIHIEGI